MMAQDVVVAVDDQPATTLTLAGMRKMFRDDGRERVITIERGGQTLRMKVKLRRLL